MTTNGYHQQLHSMIFLTIQSSWHNMHPNTRRPNSDYNTIQILSTTIYLEESNILMILGKLENYICILGCKTELNSCLMMLPPHSWSLKLLLGLIIVGRQRRGQPITCCPYLRRLTFYRLHHFTSNNKSRNRKMDQVRRHIQ